MQQHAPVTMFTEDERLTQEAVRQWARDELQPLVRPMDEQGHYEAAVLTDLFRQGLMGMEIPEKYGGSALSFTSACLAVEEISRKSTRIHRNGTVSQALAEISLWPCHSLKPLS